jgi:hypothetical protein
LTLSAVALPAAAATSPGSPPARSCFRVTDWQGWRSPSADVLYLRVRHKDVYRVDLAAGSSRLDGVGSYLISNVRTGMVCSPLDLDLSVADPSGFSSRLIPKAITKLTPEEVAAIPAKYRP